MQRSTGGHGLGGLIMMILLMVSWIFCFTCAVSNGPTEPGREFMSYRNDFTNVKKYIEFLGRLWSIRPKIYEASAGAICSPGILLPATRS